MLLVFVEIFEQGILVGAERPGGLLLELVELRKQILFSHGARLYEGYSKR